MTGAALKKKVHYKTNSIIFFNTVLSLKIDRQKAPGV